MVLGHVRFQRTLAPATRRPIVEARDNGQMHRRLIIRFLTPFLPFSSPDTFSSPACEGVGGDSIVKERRSDATVGSLRLTHPTCWGMFTWR